MSKDNSVNAWLDEVKSDVQIKIILFIISPFFAALYSFKRANTRSSYLIFLLSSIFFGLAFTVENGKDSVTGEGIDGQFYRGEFEYAKYLTSYNYMEGLTGFLSFDEGKKDYYFETVAFYLSRFTDNYHIMFMVFAFIFSYFSLKSFKFLTSENKFNFSIVSLILSYFFLYNQIFNINGVRFWTAAWVAVYCVFKIYRSNNIFYLILALLTPFFHGSYWIFLVILLLSFLLKRFEKTWILLYIISFFVSGFAVEIIKNMSDLLPTFLYKLAVSYTSEDKLNLQWSGYGWITILFKNLTSFYLNLIIFLFIFQRKNIKLNNKIYKLYLFLIMWVTIFNFLMFVPSLGNRFIVLSYPIIAYIWLVEFKDVKYQKIILCLPLVFIWDIQKQVQYYMQVLDIGYFFSNPIYLVYKYMI